MTQLAPTRDAIKRVRFCAEVRHYLFDIDIKERIIDRMMYRYRFVIDAGYDRGDSKEAVAAMLLAARANKL